MSGGGIIGGVFGAVVGFFVGGPMGALQGGMIGFGVGSMIDPIRPDVSSPGQPELGELQLTANRYDAPLPDVLGTTQLGSTFLVYGGWRAEPIQQEVNQGKAGTTYQTVGYRYYASWAQGFCLGPVDEILSLMRDDDVLWSGSLLREDAVNGEISVEVEDLGTVTFYFGTDDHQVNNTLGTFLADTSLNIPYRHQCWAFFDDCYLGDFNRVPAISLIVRKVPATPAAMGGVSIVSYYDYNPRPGHLVPGPAGWAACHHAGCHVLWWRP